MGIAERKEREKNQRREAILQAAEKVFFTRGFPHSTMDDIAETAELSKGTLYLYFKSKEDLHMGVALKAISMLSRLTEASVTAGQSAIEKLVQLGRTCIEFSRSHPDHMDAIMTLEGFEMQSLSYSAGEMQEMIYRDSTVGQVFRVVEQGVAEGSVRSDIPAPLIAHTLWMQMISVIRFVTMKKALFEMLELTPQEIYESHLELVLNGIRR